MRKQALLSVSDKTGIVEFARGLVEAGYHNLSTGGTAKLLARELEALGLVEIELTEHAILTALLPANVEGAPAVGWVAHLDTVPVSLSPDVKAQVIHYEGGNVLLNAQKDIWVRLEEHPELAAYAGQDIVFTDGTSVLGADNKAAVANRDDDARRRDEGKPSARRHPRRLRAR